MEVDKKYKIIILGSGPTGLGAGYRLKSLEQSDFLIVDQSSEVGGLAKSITDANGFTWDIGGHVHFSSFNHYNSVLDDLIKPECWNHFSRQSWIWMRKRMIPYPLQKNIHWLPDEDLAVCLDGLKNLKSLKADDDENEDFSKWALRQFGQGLFNVFMEPYNEKVWRTSLTRMNSFWIKDRVAPIDFFEIEQRLKDQNRQIDQWGPNYSFRYPKDGGTGLIWKRLAEKIGFSHFSRNDRVMGVDHKSKTIITSKGVYGFDHLISTLPLNSLLTLMIDIPDSIEKQIPEFISTSTLAFGFGFEGSVPPHLKSLNWIYFPESEFPFYRATVISNYSKKMTPENGLCWSILFETSFSKNEVIDFDAVIDSSLSALVRTGLIDKNYKILSVWKHSETYGYPVPFLNREKVLKKVQPYLESKQIFSRGRFGGWRYEISNQDHSFMQGKEIVDRLVLGTNEQIYKSV
jgi:protoporphyrinogen oxidase